MINRKNILFLILCCIFVLVSYNAYAIYFTIQLKNGNEIESEKYWEEGDHLRFFTQQGIVGIPQSIVKHIVSSEGVMTKENTAPQPEETVPAETPIDQGRLSQTDEARASELIGDIQDRMAVIDSNLDSLARNKDIYEKQRAQLEQQRIKSQARIEQLRKDSFASPKDQQDSIDFETSKLKDVEDKIADVEVKMQGADKMAETQQRMRTRLEGELATLKNSTAQR